MTVQEAYEIIKKYDSGEWITLSNLQEARSLVKLYETLKELFKEFGISINVEEFTYRFVEKIFS